MFSLQLSCPTEDAEAIAAELWNWGTVAISENDFGEEVRLLAGFESDARREAILTHFADYDPTWEQDDTDWEAETRAAWPPREVGKRLFLAPVWSHDETPMGRLRLIHNPGAAAGTGEHPCTQLMLEALEHVASGAACVVDVGTGSGILAIASRLLGASSAFAIDTDFDSLTTARENMELNSFSPGLVNGSAECIQDGVADVTLANISGTVLLSILDELLRITKPHGTLVITGFGEGEAEVFHRIFPMAEISCCNEWRALTIRLP